MRKLLLLLLLTAAALPRERNDAMLGVVRVERDGKVFVAKVLPKSPAAKAGLEDGDQLLAIDGQDVASPADVDRALKGLREGEQIPVVYRRGKKKKKTVKAKLIERGDYREAFLKRRRRGETGFEAPAWHIYAWSNVKKGNEPTRANTKGKVVVFHCFQSW